MLRNRCKLVCLALVPLLAAVGCQVRFGPASNPAGSSNPSGVLISPAPGAGNLAPGGLNAGAANDPAEKAAIDVVKKQDSGWVKQDNTQPKNPVIEVNVWRSSFTDDDLKALASLTKVRKMSCTQTKITGTGFKDLTGMKDLTDLNVSQTPVTDEGLKAIAGLTQLKILAMRGTKVTDPGLRPLASLTQLEELAVANNFDRGDTGAVFIATNLKQLKRLYIDNSAIGDAGVIELAKMPNLQLLTINGTRVTDKAVEALTGLKSLEELHLSHFPTDKTADILARCENLRVLHLFDAQITDKGLKTLGKLPHLKKLDLTFCGKINSKAITEFIKAHPDCTVKK